MSEVKTVKTKADADKLLFGDQWIWDLPEDPEEAFDTALKLEADLGDYIDERFRATFVVEVDDTHVSITADRDTVAQLGGDVKDGKSTFTAGKAKKFKVTEKMETVLINGLPYEV